MQNLERVLSCVNNSSNGVILRPSSLVNVIGIHCHHIDGDGYAELRLGSETILKVDIKTNFICFCNQAYFKFPFNLFNVEEHTKLLHIQFSKKTLKAVVEVHIKY